MKEFTLRMLLRKIVFTTFLLLSSAYCALGAIPFRGTVVDKMTREVLVGATLIVEGSTHGTSTDAEGRFELDLAPGTSVVIVS